MTNHGSTIQSVKEYKAALVCLDKFVFEYSQNNLLLNAEQKKKDHALNKHGHILFIVRSLGLSVIAFIILEMLFVLWPKEFPYYCLAPIFGVIAEYVFKRRYEKTEMKPIVKNINAKIKQYQETVDTLDKKIMEMSHFADNVFAGLGNPEGEMTGNICVLDYIMRNDDLDLSVSFAKRYDDFINIYNNLTEEHAELKNKIDAAQTAAHFRNIIINQRRNAYEKQIRNSVQSA